MRSTISGRRWKTMKLERTLARRIHRELANDSSTLTSPAMLSKRTNFVDQAKWDGTNGHKYSFYTQVTFAERDQSESLQLVLKLNEARRSRSSRSGDFYRNARRIDRSEPRFVSCPFNRTFLLPSFDHSRRSSWYSGGQTFRPSSETALTHQNTSRDVGSLSASPRRGSMQSRCGSDAR